MSAITLKLSSICTGICKETGKLLVCYILTVFIKFGLNKTWLGGNIAGAAIYTE